jgi:hypothetical protein
MATTINVHDLEKVKGDLQDLSREMPHVAVRAINKALVGVKTDMKKLVREEYNYKTGALDKRMTSTTATRNNITGIIVSKGGAVHLTDIAGTSQPAAKTAKGRDSKAFGAGKGVVVNVRKDTGKKIIPRAFIAKGRNSGKEIVFRRKSEGGRMVPRYPIEAKYTAHPEVIYNAPRNWARIQVMAATRLDDNIKREVDAELRRIEGKW